MSPVVTITTHVRSVDGTTLAVDRCGRGPGVVLVPGAFTDRSVPVLTRVAQSLAPWFTVLNYDRRGRGASGDTLPGALEREVEDLAAVIDAAGGSAMVFGGSSGAGVAIEAASRLPTGTIIALALWEPPYHVDDSLGREAMVMGSGSALPRARLSALALPALVLTGDRSPGWRADAGRAVADAIPGACLRVLAGQWHDVTPEALASELLEFFTAALGDTATDATSQSSG